MSIEKLSISLQKTPSAQISTETPLGIMANSETQLLKPSSLKVSLIVSSNNSPTNNLRSRIPRSPSPRSRLSTNTIKTIATTSSPSAEAQPSPKSTKSDQKSPTPNQTPAHGHPNYIACHLGEPCSVQSLDHLLKCGHKVLTAGPENCASNCQPSSNLKHTNPRSIDEPFVCLTCVVEQIKQERAEKMCSFVAAMEAVATVMAKGDPKRWIEEKLAIMMIAWREIEVDRIQSQVEKGRSCHAFYIHEEYVGLIGAAVEARNSQGSKPNTRAVPDASVDSYSEKAPVTEKPFPKLTSRLPMPQRGM